MNSFQNGLGTLPLVKRQLELTLVKVCLVFNGCDQWLHTKGVVLLNFLGFGVISVNNIDNAAKLV